MRLICCCSRDHITPRRLLSTTWFQLMSCLCFFFPSSFSSSSFPGGFAAQPRMLSPRWWLVEVPWMCEHVYLLKDWFRSERRRQGISKKSGGLRRVLSRFRWFFSVGFTPFLSPHTEFVPPQLIRNKSGWGNCDTRHTGGDQRATVGGSKKKNERLSSV